MTTHSSHAGSRAAHAVPAAADPLLTRLARLRDRVAELVAERGAADPTAGDPLRGLYLSEEAVRHLLGPSATPYAAVFEGGESSGAVPEGRLERLAGRLGLTELDTRILLIALAPDLDRSYEQLYGYLNDDVSRRRATVGLALDLCGLPVHLAAARARCRPSAPLSALGLLTVEDAERPFLSRELRVPDRVVAHLLGDDTLDAALAGHVRALTRPPVPAVPSADGGFTARLADRLAAAPVTVYLREHREGDGLVRAAAALRAAGVEALYCTPPAAEEELTGLLPRLLREARLRGCAIVVSPLPERPAPLLRALTAADVSVLFAASRPYDPQWCDRDPLVLDVPRPPTGAVDVWAAALGVGAGGPGFGAGADSPGLGAGADGPGPGARADGAGADGPRLGPGADSPGLDAGADSPGPGARADGARADSPELGAKTDSPGPGARTDGARTDSPELGAKTDSPGPGARTDGARTDSPELGAKTDSPGPGAKTDRAGVGGPGFDLAATVAPYRLGGDRIERAARAALGLAAFDGTPVTAAHLRLATRQQSASGLERHARRIRPEVGWGDLVLPDKPLAQLRELALRARHRDRVLGDWRLSAGGGRGHGVLGLFAGESGTGKTLSAEVVAAELGLDLYVVQLSSIVDKYVGETEKNLERIFTEADRTDAVLLFDEADAVFGKRSEVKDSHDKHANMESAYLLQRLESFDGIALLTTNLRANIDEAFTRRLDLVVDFPFPDTAQRLALWRHSLAAVPCADGTDPGAVARDFELAGGSIRSAVVTAAYAAAGRAGPVTTADLREGAEREYRKAGRLVPGEGNW